MTTHSTSSSKDFNTAIYAAESVDMMLLGSELADGMTFEEVMKERNRVGLRVLVDEYTLSLSSSRFLFCRFEKSAKSSM